MLEHSSALEALMKLAAAEDPREAHAARMGAQRALGDGAADLEPLMELLMSRALEVSLLRRLSGTDELTGVGNRRTFKEALERETARADRTGHPPAVVLLDLDGLKHINDTHGHAAGDEAIRKAARAMVNMLRGADLVARLGGDEFAVLLPEASEAGAMSVARRLRAAVETRTVAGEPLRTSIGWALAQPGETAGSLVDRADRHLYADKIRRKSFQAAEAA